MIPFGLLVSVELSYSRGQSNTTKHNIDHVWFLGLRITAGKAGKFYKLCVSMLRKRMARAEFPNSKKLLNLPPKILPTGQNLREIYESRRNRLLLMSWVWFCNIWSFLSSSFVTNCGSSIAFFGERSCAKCPRMTKTYKNSVTLLRLPFSSNSDITHVFQSEMLMLDHPAGH